MSKLLIDVDELSTIYSERSDAANDDLLVIETLHRRLVYCQRDLLSTWSDVISALVGGEWPAKNLLYRHHNVIDRTGETLVSLGELLVSTGERDRAYIERVLEVLRDSEEVETETVS